jgi:hypothetical protein
MLNPKSRSDISDSVSGTRRKALSSENAVGKRVLEAMAGRDLKWLSSATGISDSTLSGYIAGGIASAEKAVAIGRALGRSVEWLMTGTEISAAGSPPNRPGLVSVDEADFVGLPRYDLGNITEAGKGHRIETIPFRRDWLMRRVGTATGLWVIELFATYDELGLYEGDALICSDIPRDAPPPDNSTCIFLGDGIFVARYRDRWTTDAGEAAGPRVGPADLREHDVQPIARIRSRLLAGI